VSQISEVLWADYEAFAERDLSGFEVEYLFLDAVYESLREQGGLKEGVLVAWAICSDGCKVLLHLTLGNKESYANWLDFLRGMVRRGLRAPVQTTTDGSPGVIRAVEEVFPHSLRQRCLAHKTRNVLDKVPDSGQGDDPGVLLCTQPGSGQDGRGRSPGQLSRSLPGGDAVLPG
jgi:putative transposase